MVAKVALKDGRIITLKTAVDAARPRAALIGRSVQPSPLAGSSNIQLADPGELPQDATVVFSIRTQTPAVFSHDETIDVATGDESFTSSLSLASGALALENSQVVVATFNPAKAFGPSAYGPLKFRVNAKGVAGDWQPLANLVRLPLLKTLDCPQTPEVACKLSGANLYLIDSVSGDAGFAKPVVGARRISRRRLARASPQRRHLVPEASGQPASDQSRRAVRAGDTAGCPRRRSGGGSPIRAARRRRAVP